MTNNDWNWMKWLKLNEMLKGLYFSMGSKWKFWNKGTDDDRGLIKNYSDNSNKNGNGQREINGKKSI